MKFKKSKNVKLFLLILIYGNFIYLKSLPRQFMQKLGKAGKLAITARQLQLYGQSLQGGGDGPSYDVTVSADPYSINPTGTGSTQINSPENIGGTVTIGSSTSGDIALASGSNISINNSTTDTSSGAGVTVGSLTLVNLLAGQWSVKQLTNLGYGKIFLNADAGVVISAGGIGNPPFPFPPINPFTTSIEMNIKDIEISAFKTLKFASKGQLKAETGGLMKFDVGGSFLASSKGVMTLTSNGSTTIRSGGVMNINGTTTNISSTQLTNVTSTGITNINGKSIKVTSEGAISTQATGGISFNTGGLFSIKAAAAFDVNATTTGSIKTAGTLTLDAAGIATLKSAVDTNVSAGAACTVSAVGAATMTGGTTATVTATDGLLTLNAVTGPATFSSGGILNIQTTTGIMNINTTTGAINIGQTSTGVINLGGTPSTAVINIGSATSGVMNLLTGGAFNLTATGAATLNSTGALSLTSAGAIALTATGGATLTSTAPSSMTSAVKITLTSPIVDILAASFNWNGMPAIPGTGFSAKRFKENIEDAAKTDWIYKLRVCDFDYIDKQRHCERRNTGLIAEEVEEINPDAVIYYNDEIITVKYYSILAALLREHQLLKERYEKLEKECQIIKLYFEKLLEIQNTATAA